MFHPSKIRSATTANPCGLKRRRAARSAIATVELAICLPVLSLIMFGSIQATNLIFLQHAATAGAYEGSLELAKTNASNDSIKARVQQVLDAREVINTEIEILPLGTDVTKTPPGTILTLQVTADVRSNLTLFGFFVTPDQVMGKVVSIR